MSPPSDGTRNYCIGRHGAAGRILRSFLNATTRRWTMKIASTRTLVIVVLVGLGLFATLPLSAATSAPKEPEAKPVEVTYFFLPG
jgi:hypothetical protein